MKRLFYLLLTLPMLLSACNKDDSGASIATISFERRTISLSSGSVDINLQVSGLDPASTQEYVVALKLSGSASENEYELSSDHFVIGGNNPVTTIKIRAKNYGSESKNLVMNLVAPEGFTLGTNPSMIVTLGTQEAIVYNFLEGTMELKDVVKPEITLLNMDGSKYSVSQEMHIPAVVDKEQSTAVQGEHFEFDGDAEFVFVPGKERVSVTIKLLKLEEGKDKIVLKVDPEATQYIPGDPGKCTITIVGSDYDKINGTWYVYQQLTDKNFMINTNFVDEAALTGFPVATEDDTFTFDTKKNVLTTSLQSDLKNFFGETCNMTWSDKTYDIGPYDSSMIPPYPISLIDLDNCNRDFSATSTSTEKNAYIGIRLVEEQSTGDEILELYLIDYKSKSFCTDWLEYDFIYGTTRPVATSSGVYLLFYLKKK